MGTAGPLGAGKDGSLPASLVLAIESGAHRLTNAYGSVSRLLAPSEFLADLLLRGGLGDDRVRHIPNFVDSAAIKARQGSGDGFVSIGRISSEKGVDTAIRAIGLLPGSRLTVAGDGPLRQELETLAHSVAPGRVRFVGHVGKAEVAALNEGAVAAVLAARWHENMPLSVLETMAAAVPMVVSGLGGLPELIQDGVEGLVVPPDNPHTLAAALGQLLADPAAAAAMGSAARAKAIANHDPSNHLARLFELYEEAAFSR